MNEFKNKNRSRKIKNSFCYVDLAELASAASGANADMLLYTLQAQIHDLIIKQKEPLLQEIPFVAPDLARNVRTSQRLIVV